MQCVTGLRHNRFNTQQLFLSGRKVPKIVEGQVKMPAAKLAKVKAKPDFKYKCY